jgi:HipA-like protein
MRKANVYRNGVLAGELIEESRQNYLFRYDPLYLTETKNPSISLTLPKNQHEHRNTGLFPFFVNMLSEGVNKKIQCRQLKIDESDHFGLLMATAQYDTVGAITIRPRDSA